MPRVVVLAAAGVLVAGAGVVAFLLLLMAPVLPGPAVVGTVVFLALTTLAAGAAVVLTMRGFGARWGCSVLVLGALSAALVLILLLYQR